MNVPTTEAEAKDIGAKLNIPHVRVMKVYGIFTEEEAQLKAQLDSTVNVSEIWEIFYIAPAGSLIRKEALKKILSLAKTIKEKWTICCSLPVNSPIRMELLRAVVCATDDAESLWQIYDNIMLEGLIPRTLLLEKLLYIATTAEDYRKVFEHSIPGSNIETAALQKVVEMIE